MSSEQFPHDLKDKRIAFVGRLGGMSRRNASDLVRQFGAKVSRKLDANLNLIVLGDDISTLLESEQWLTPPLADAVNRGQMEVISETELWQRLDELKTSQENQAMEISADAGLPQTENPLVLPTPFTRLFTPSMLASMFELPVAVIRQWHRMGLIRPVRQVKKLPYYDLKEVAGARSLAQLLEKGVSPALIKDKLEQLEKFIPDVARSINQLSILVSGKQVLFRKNGELVDSKGQLHFDFGNAGYELRATGVPSNIEKDSNNTDSRFSGNPSSISKSGGSVNIDKNNLLGFPWTVVESPQSNNEAAHEVDFGEAFDAALTMDSPLEEASELEWSEQTLREDIVYLQQSGRLEDALAASRLLALEFKLNSDDCAIMSDILYRMNQIEAARERLLVALELDPSNVEARLTLGCIFQQQGASSSAEAAFKGCLEQDSSYPDALYHLALLLDEQDRSDEALDYWKRFWELSPSGPWKVVAANRLGLEVPLDDDDSEF